MAGVISGCVTYAGKGELSCPLSNALPKKPNLDPWLRGRNLSRHPVLRIVGSWCVESNIIYVYLRDRDSLQIGFGLFGATSF